MAETPQPADLIVFGGTGDLSIRKLLPYLAGPPMTFGPFCREAHRAGLVTPPHERLLMDVLAGNPTLFMRRDEVEAAWRWIDPIISEWESRGTAPEPYPAGSAGPASAHELVGRSGRGLHGEGLA